MQALFCQTGMTLNLTRVSYLSKKIRYFGRGDVLGLFTAVFNSFNAFKTSIFSTDYSQNSFSACSVYRTFIENFLSVAPPLNICLRRNKERN